jgi:predicted TIM-barrel fold metal-dependent hydrolase
MDFHVHPFDVYSGDIKYQIDADVEGLWGKGTTAYQSPSIDYNGQFPSQLFQKATSSPRAMLLASRLLYSHTGPKVFTDQLDLAGIKGALLLPIARIPGTAMDMVDACVDLFQYEERFHMACPFPVGTPANALKEFFIVGKKVKNLRAIKIHPNLCDLNPITDAGKELIETTLIAAGELKLPVIIHGGPSDGLLSDESKQNGNLNRLANIKWDLSSSPVIIAHAGCFGLSESETISTIPILKVLMDKFQNLLVDTSALNLNSLQSVMTNVDHTRMIFGSDALYFKIWRSWVTFLQALRAVSRSPDDDLIQIASLNPTQCLNYTINSA